MNYYHFIFAPEGRIVAEIQADNIRAAKRKFYACNKAYARAKGEIYIVTL